MNNILGELGTMSKYNLRGITLVDGLYMGDSLSYLDLLLLSDIKKTEILQSGQFSARFLIQADNTSNSGGVFN